MGTITTGPSLASAAGCSDTGARTILALDALKSTLPADHRIASLTIFPFLTKGRLTFRASWSNTTTVNNNSFAFYNYNLITVIYHSNVHVLIEPPLDTGKPEKATPYPYAKTSRSKGSPSPKTTEYEVQDECSRLIYSQTALTTRLLVVRGTILGSGHLFQNLGKLGIFGSRTWD